MRKLMIPMLAWLMAVVAGMSVGLNPAAHASSSQPVSQQRLTAEVKVAQSSAGSAESPAAPRDTITLELNLKVQSGWKIQAGKGSGDEIEPYIPTTITIAPPEGWTVGKLTWPNAKEFTMGEGEFAETLKGYNGEISVTAPITIAANAGGEHIIDIKIEYQACDATTCEMPTEMTTRATVQVVGNSVAAPQTTDDVDAPADAKPQAAGAARPTFFGWSLPEFTGPLGLMLLFVISIVAGAVLNLTPCVLPVIPLKIMAISAHANSPGRSMVLGLAMAAGVVAFWVAIGIPAALVAGATDPSRLFGIWWVTLSIGVIIALMALGIMGMFTLQLPQSVYAINPKADNALGSFLFGVMTGVLGLPCFGFVAGGLLFASTTLPAATIMTIFASLGIGMAAPYLVLSAKPSLVNKIPRTGPASELVKQIMGLLLLAAAAYFVGSGLVALVLEKPYMARQLHWWAVAVFAALAGLWLIVRTFQITRSAGKRVAFTLMGLVIGGIAVLFAMDSTAKARSNWEKFEAARGEGSASFVAGAWNDYSPAAFDAAREAGHVVVLDFTAEWCINCKVLKAGVLNRDPVRSELEKSDVVSFTVDLTAKSAPGWKFLNDLGQTGIPQLFVWTPGSNTPWQANAYSPPQVMEAIENARSARATTETSKTVWTDYTPESFEAARRAGKTTVLFFNAEWATACSLPDWRQRVLDKDPVLRELTHPNVAAFEVDVTLKDAPGWDLLQQLGHTGIPQLFIFERHSDEPWFANVFTSDQVVEALQVARSAQVARH